MASLLRLDTLSPTQMPTSGFVMGLPTMLLQQPTTASQTASPLTQTLRNNLPTSSTTALGVPSNSSDEGHSLAFKVGLAMIPVAVILCVVSIVGFFWLRRRKAHKRCPTSDSAPEKELRSETSFETEPRQSTSKVLSMAAFSTPFDKDRNEIPHEEQSKTRQGRKSVLNMAAARFSSTDSIHPGRDSPIDRSSPFRLKRGNTTKRYRYKSAMKVSWPMPPESAWIKQQSTAEGPHETISGSKNSSAVP